MSLWFSKKRKLNTIWFQLVSTISYKNNNKSNLCQNKLENCQFTNTWWVSLNSSVLKRFKKKNFSKLDKKQKDKKFVFILLLNYSN